MHEIKTASVRHLYFYKQSTLEYKGDQITIILMFSKEHEIKDITSMHYRNITPFSYSRVLFTRDQNEYSPQYQSSLHKPWHVTLKCLHGSHKFEIQP